MRGPSRPLSVTTALLQMCERRRARLCARSENTHMSMSSLRSPSVMTTTVCGKTHAKLSGPWENTPRHMRAPSPPPSPPCEGFQDGSGLSGFGNLPKAWERAVAKQSIECQRELALARINGMADLYEAVLSTLPPEECASLAHRAALLGTQVEVLALEASVDTVSADTKGATLCMPQ